ncbi:unnamed protein product, partial [Iphiclides podalirius]
MADAAPHVNTLRKRAEQKALDSRSITAPAPRRQYGGRPSESTASNGLAQHRTRISTAKQQSWTWLYRRAVQGGPCSARKGPRARHAPPLTHLDIPNSRAQRILADESHTLQRSSPGLDRHSCLWRTSQGDVGSAANNSAIVKPRVLSAAQDLGWITRNTVKLTIS